MIETTRSLSFMLYIPRASPKIPISAMGLTEVAPLHNEFWDSYS
jgi:hypothetical protein